MSTVFYGESYAHNGGSTISGPSIDVWQLYNHFSDGTQTLSAGGAILLGSYADPQDKTAFAAATDSQASWVIEVTAGSGTLRLSTGLDPGWRADDPTVATEALGTYDVASAAPQTIVSTQITSVTHADLVAQASQVAVLIECTAGSVEIKQVKLRVWPAAGPSGAWGPPVPGSVSSNSIFAVAGFGSETKGVGNEDWHGHPHPDAKGAADAALVAAMSDLNSHAGEIVNGSLSNSSSWQTSSYGGAGNSEITVYAPGGDSIYYSGSAEIHSDFAYVAANYSNAQPSGTYAGVDPREHRYETEAAVRSAGGGPIAPRFAGWTDAAFTFHASAPYSSGDSDNYWPTSPAALQQHDVSPSILTKVDNYGTYSTPYQVLAGGAQTALMPGGAGVHDVEMEVPFAGGECMLVVAQAPGINGPADSAAGVTDGPVTEGMPTLNYFWRMNVYAKIARCQYLVSFGDVQWFDPTLPWVEDVPTPVEVYPVPGATLLSMQDLAVIPGGVDVNFATS